MLAPPIDLRPMASLPPKGRNSVSGRRAPNAPLAIAAKSAADPDPRKPRRLAVFRGDSTRTPYNFPAAAGMDRTTIPQFNDPLIKLQSQRDEIYLSSCAGVAQW
ncbi:MAG: hypothetical protein O2800_04625 [Planctomycetota bacterium]|nr:hypothetical protein [Planctomycetota bacterium]